MRPIQSITPQSPSFPSPTVPVKKAAQRARMAASTAAPPKMAGAAAAPSWSSSSSESSSVGSASSVSVAVPDSDSVSVSSSSEAVVELSSVVSVPDALPVSLVSVPLASDSVVLSLSVPVTVTVSLALPAPVVEALSEAVVLSPSQMAPPPAAAAARSPGSQPCMRHWTRSVSVVRALWASEVQAQAGSSTEQFMAAMAAERQSTWGVLVVSFWC